MALADREWLGEPGDEQGFEVLIRRYLSWREVHGYSQRGHRSARSALRTFARWCLERGAARPAEVSYPLLQRYQRWLFYHRGDDGRTISLRTQAHRLTHVKGLFRWLVREHYVLYNPASEIQLPKYPRKLPQDVLTAAEVEAILATIDLATPQGIRDRAILELLYSTGIRRLETSRLDVYDLDRERRWLMVREGKGGKDRMVPAGERAVAWVERYLEDVRPGWVVAETEPALFLSAYGERITPDGMSHLVSRRILDSGVRRSGSCHLFRHTMATLMLENGADIRYIQQILGHASLETTEVYTRVTIRHLREIHDATHPAAKMARRKRREDEPATAITREDLEVALAREVDEEMDADGGAGDSAHVE